MFEHEAQSALGLTGSLIDRFGPRLAGSPSCLATADALKDHAAPLADRAWNEDFPVHPGSFLGFIRVLVIIYAASTLALPFAAWASALAASIGLAILVLGFILYVGILDPFYPRRTGRNVLASLEPSGKVERTLIVSGHHDSARIFNFYVDRPELYGRRIYGGIGAFVVFWAASCVLALAGAPMIVDLAAALVFLAGFVLVAPLWNFASRDGSPGAGDNLAASCVALEVLRHFRSSRDGGEGLKGTRLIFASFDAEEAGLRGARAWARAHRDEVALSPTFCFNMDCLFSYPDIKFLSSDVNGSVKLSSALARACADMAHSRGIPAKVEPIAFLTGGTDAAELARVGVRATTLIAMKWSNEERSSAYHTPGDTLEAVEPAAVEAAIRVAVALAEQLDTGALD